MESLIVITEENNNKEDEVIAAIPESDISEVVPVIVDDDNELLIYQSQENLTTPQHSFFSWSRTSEKHLIWAEAQMLAKIKSPYRQIRVKVSDNTEINTIICGSGPPLVLIHGMGGGIGFWVANLDALAKYHTVYAFDIVGFGRSSRSFKDIPITPEEAESFFISHIEDWRKTLKLDKFFLMGHSFGGFLAACYALEHPSHLIKLILADPWGVPERPADADEKLKTAPFKYKFIHWGAQHVNPFTLLRAAGPIAKPIIQKVRPDLSMRFIEFFNDQNGKVVKDDEPEGPAPPEVADYIYHLNAQTPAVGELLFWKMLVPIGYAVNPLIPRLHKLDPAIPVSFIYGNHSWMEPRWGKYVKENILNTEDHDVDVVIIFNAGHHVYIDDYKAFNKAVIAATEKLRLKSKDSKI